MGLLDDILSLGRSNRITPNEEAELVGFVTAHPELESKGENMADETKSVYEEHNTKTPHADVKDQCQCKDCKSYREGAK